MSPPDPRRVLVLTGHRHDRCGLVDSLRAAGHDVHTADNVDEALAALRAGAFCGVFSDAEDFLPLERELVGQQSSLILNTVGEGVCIVDDKGRAAWMNKRFKAWSPRVHEAVRRCCNEAFDLFSHGFGADAHGNGSPAAGKSKRYSLNVDDQQYLELVASPVVSSRGEVIQVVAVVWDATGSRHLQQRIDAIDKAGRELVKLEGEALKTMNAVERLKLLEEKIVRSTRELMHFDHFAIRLLNRKENKLELAMSAGLPEDALNVQLECAEEGNGISGYVCATGQSYICRDVRTDPRYVVGLDQAASSLTVPLMLYDKTIGIFNVESRQPAAFDEEDRQFAEIFGRYVAMALNMLDLMLVERRETSHKIADEVCAEVSGPLNDIVLDAEALLEEHVGDDELRGRLKTVLANAATIRTALRQAQVGPNTTILGAGDVRHGLDDPVLSGKRVLVVDDEPNIRLTIADVLRKFHADVTVLSGGQDAIDQIEGGAKFDLVLSDIKMPDASGYEVFAAVRHTANPPPVILMTGFGYDPGHCIVRASQEGLKTVLFKPFKVEQLLSEVRGALGAPAA